MASVSKEQKISKIEEGTVIDHIPTDMIYKVVEILKLVKHDGMISIATNLSSKKIGKKALLKIERRFLTEDEVNKIAVLAPNATVSIIKRYDVKNKRTVTLPKTIDNVIKCSNPACITNHESVHSKFFVKEKAPLQVKCYYCERHMSREEIEIV